ncbi:MAG: ferredoxin--NADP reductase [Flavobacteriales bacterium]|nr:ferredoxin--NADP reductase [Flavobacteriales bacterium]
MAAGFYRLKVDRIIRETPDAVSIRFLVPPPLKSVFTYKAGQYLTLRMEINGEDVRRSYSVCESPLIDPMPSVAVKEVEGGKMSTYLNRQLKEGDLIEAMAPMGNFTLEPQTKEKRHVVLYGGGSGITPLKSILKTVLEFEKQSGVTLLYANRNESSIIFHSELEEYASRYPDRLKIVYALDNPPANWSGYSGMLNPDLISDFLKKLPAPASICEHYICGPAPMMKMIETTLEYAGVGRQHIHLEYFTAVEKTDQADNESIEDGELVTRTIQVEVFGQKKQITVEPDQSVLEAAQDAGMDPPYSCTVGVCTTCRARLRSGRVHMDEREGLSDAEIEEGYVLTCQSHPLTDDVDLVYE